MQTEKIAALLGNAYVETTSFGGPSPEQLAERALAKIIYVGQDSHQAIRDQAEALKDSIRHILVFYMREAMAAERTNLFAKLQQAGHEDTANLIRSI
jgi:hypothetical protein